jgi:hypothetical protein
LLLQETFHFFGDLGSCEDCSRPEKHEHKTFMSLRITIANSSIRGLLEVERGSPISYDSSRLGQLDCDNASSHGSHCSTSYIGVNLSYHACAVRSPDDELLLCLHANADPSRYPLRPLWKQEIHYHLSGRLIDCLSHVVASREL